MKSAPAPESPLDRAHRILREIYGYPHFRPGQEPVLRHVLDGSSALLVMPTGAGKSLCYQIPALALPGTGIIVSPLIALMQDQVDALHQLGVRAAYVNSSQDPATQSAVLAALRRGELDLLYVAPERVVTTAFLEILATAPLALFAIDEAHCISQWGHEFRQDYRGLVVLRERWPQLPCLAVTATADDPTRRDIAEQLRLRRDDIFVTGFDRPNLRYSVVTKSDGRRQLLGFLRDRHVGHAGIVYCATRKRVDATAEWLRKQDIDALPYHAGMDTAERAANQRRFLREDAVVMVATVAFGMGIDKPDVRFVAHLDTPKSLEAYYQESGRAGRDGEPADCWMAYGWGDVMQMRHLIGEPDDENRHRWVELRKLEQLLGYCEAAECRRKVLLGYFGEPREEPCGNCDVCSVPVETWEATEAAQKLLSCVRRTGEWFGVAHVIDVLLARVTEKVERRGHDGLSTWGIGEEHDALTWRSIARQLVAMQLLAVNHERHGALALTPGSWEVLRGEREVHLKRERSVKGARKTRTRRRGAVEMPSDLDDQAQSLFESLRELRRELAQSQGVPAYVVFQDRSLKEMAQERPRNLEELALITGVGAAKLKRYGKRFVARIVELG